MWNLLVLPVLNTCAHCGKPHAADGPYCSFACECWANGWDPDEALELPEEDAFSFERGADPSACLCALCGQNPVRAEDGYDTCADCIASL